MTTNSEQTNHNPLRLLACFRAGKDSSSRIIEYAEQVTTLLNGRLDRHLFKESEPPTLPKRYFSTYKLILFSELTTFKNARTYQTALGRNPNSYQSQPALLLARQPHWPLQKLLLIIRGEATDRITLAWGTMFARLACCKVTTLVVIPPGFRMRTPTISQTLQSDTLHGRHIRHALDNFAANQIDGVVKISYRTPLRQLQQELASISYDLIILGSEPPGRVFAWRLETLLDPLLEWSQQPLLVAGAAYPSIIAPGVNGGPS